jgi:hypothetical protein
MVDEEVDVLDFLRELRPETLVAYHGGGYDGCIYEWNYAFFDEDGQFHDLFSSGCMGCRTEAELRDTLEDEQQRLQQGRSANVDLYHLDVEADRQRLVDHEAVKGVFRLWDGLRAANLEYDLRPKCDSCGKRFPLSCLEPENPYGEGGIEIGYREFKCDDCRGKDERE